MRIGVSFFLLKILQILINSKEMISNMEEEIEKFREIEKLMNEVLSLRRMMLSNSEKMINIILLKKDNLEKMTKFISSQTKIIRVWEEKVKRIKKIGTILKDDNKKGLINLYILLEKDTLEKFNSRYNRLSRSTIYHYKIANIERFILS